MDNSKTYFNLAREEEKNGHFASALLFYLSSFCESFNFTDSQYPYQATEKIRKLQSHLFLSDSELLEMVRSYGRLTDQECRGLLSSCIDSDLAGIERILSGSEASYGH